MEATLDKFEAPDGTAIALHRMGQGRPLLLLHGLFSSAQMNWIRFGHAEKLAGAGYHVVMPDFRVHGESEAPQSEAAYPPDVLIQDMRALIAHLGWDDFDLGGFSLGARTVAKLLTHNIRPARAMLLGMGWEGLGGWGARLQFFFDAIDKRNEVKIGDPHFMAVSFMKSQKIDPIAARLLLASFGELDVDALTRVDVPIGVICGADDHDNGSAAELTRRLKNARYIEVPGEHMSSVTKGAMGDAMLDFLGDGAAL